MSAIADLLHTPVAEALGWALVHFVWEGALIASLLAAALRVCRGASVRYAAACAAMAAMPVAFIVTMAMSLSYGGQAIQAAAPAPVGVAGSAGAAVEPTPAISERIRQALPWLVSFWAAGTLLTGLYRLAGWAAVERMRRSGVCAAPPVWRQRLRELAARVGVSAPVALLESSLAQAPMVIGALRPAILLPVGLLSGLPPAQVEAILLHELAHVRRLDYLVNLMQSAVESLLFYHPAVWWVSALMRTERENCCDDAAVRVQGDAREYAKALVVLEQLRSAGREPAPAATGGNLMNRIRRLLSQPRRPRSAAGLIVSGALVAALLSTIAIAQQQQPGDGATTESAGPYAKWLSEDVVYIIADEEKAAFERLGADEERDHFIEQFWARRDPTPNSAPNEFRDEHYRRITYANSRFAAGQAGWRTDRGRIYILYGPPDEIEAHPSGGAVRYSGESELQFASEDPFQIWRYRHIEGMGENVLLLFVDADRSGSYRLVRGPDGDEVAKVRMLNRRGPWRTGPRDV